MLRLNWHQIYSCPKREESSDCYLFFSFKKDVQMFVFSNVNLSHMLWLWDTLWIETLFHTVTYEDMIWTHCISVFSQCATSLCLCGWLFLSGSFFVTASWGISPEGKMFTLISSWRPLQSLSSFIVQLPAAKEHCDEWASGLFWKRTSSLLQLICWVMAHLENDAAFATIVAHLRTGGLCYLLIWQCVMLLLWFSFSLDDRLWGCVGGGCTSKTQFCVL